MYPQEEGGGGGRKFHIKRTRGYSAFLVPIKVFSLKRCTAGAFAVPFSVLSRVMAEAI